MGVEGVVVCFRPCTFLIRSQPNGPTPFSFADLEIVELRPVRLALCMAAVVRSGLEAGRFPARRSPAAVAIRT